jgi:putative hydrolase of the HAD superfamily
MLRALILDFGEVLVRPQPAAIVAEMAALAGLDDEGFRRRYWHHRRFYDGGAPADEYWKLVLAGPPPAANPTGAPIDRLKDADARSWTDYREDLWTLTAEFRARGGKTAFLSNGVPEVMNRVRAERALGDYFDAVVVSYEVGFTKPDAKIYELCLSQLGVLASSALFVDDRAENIEAAERLGIQTMLFRGDASVEDVRTRLALH